MKFTKKQQERINLLQGDNSYLNPILCQDSDVFTKFEIGTLFEEPKKTGNWITLNVETKTHNHEELSEYHNYFFTKHWHIFISPRGKMFAPSFPSYLEGRKKTPCGRITLSNIVF